MNLSKIIFTILFSSGILFGIIFIWYTAYYKKRVDKTTNYLTWFLVFLTLNNIQILWVDNFVNKSDCFLKNLHPFLFFVFVVPLFHSFIVSYLQIEKNVKKYLNFAFIIFIIGMLARIIFSPLFSLGNCINIGYYVQIEEIAIAALSIFVFFEVIRIIFFKKQLYKVLLSYDTLKWINQFLIFGAIVLGFWIFAIIYNLKNVVNPEVFIYYPLRISSSVLLYWVGYTGSFKNFLTTERTEIRAKISEFPLTKTVISQKFSPRFAKICNFIETNNVYFDPDYSLEQLSKAIEINRTTLSDEINKNAKQNFNDFLNSYRIKKSKMLLKNPIYKDYTIDAIGLECGFNSKSTFYAAFKKVTNTTPATYRKIDF